MDRWVIFCTLLLLASTWGLYRLAASLSEKERS